MKKLAKFWKNYARGIFYALTIVLGMYLAFYELDRGHDLNFRSMVLITSLIFLVELYTGWLFRRQQTSQIAIPHISGNNWFTELAYHLLMPMGMYFSIVGFGYFNKQMHLRLTLLALAFFVLTILFTNIRAYYENRKTLETRTHYVYDITKLIIFFATADTIFNFSWNTAEKLLGLLLVAIMAWIFILLLLLRSHKQELKAFLVSGLLTIALFGVLMLLSQLTAHNPLQLSLTAAILFYFVMALVHHLMHRDLSWSIVLEYFAVIALAIGFIFGLS